MIQTNPVHHSETLQQILSDFLAHAPDTAFAVVATAEGLVVGTAYGNVLPVAPDDTLAATAVRTLELARTINRELAQNNSGRILIEGEKYAVIAGEAGARMALIVAVDANAKLGMAMYAFKRAAAAISRLYN